MSQTHCEIIRDLLPLYIDSVCSEESRNLVEAHINKCENCKREYELLLSDLAISEEHDASAIKKIKHRILTEKIVIGLLVVFVIACIALTVLLHVNTDYTGMNDLICADMISVEEDDHGNLWLIRKDIATEADYAAANQYTPDGKVITDFLGLTLNTDIDKSQIAIRVELCTSPFNHFKLKTIGCSSIIEEERSVLINVNEKPNVNQVIIFTPDAPEGTVLWSR